MHKVCLPALLALAGASALWADGTGPFSVLVPKPAADIWMYPHGPGGDRHTASTFTSLPDEPTVWGPEDRFGQFVLKFDTVAAGVPAGLGADNYKPERVVLTAVIAKNTGIPYDPTEDARQTSAPGGTPDLDVGRPIELHGTGFRGTATAANYNELSSFGSGDVHGRYAYAMGYSPTGVARDVSHNVTEGFDSLPWAIGRVMVSPADGEPYEELAPGQIIPYLAHVEFELNLSLPGVAAYVRDAFDKGYIWLTISSLHSTTEMSTEGYPVFFTKENPEEALFGDVAAFVNVDYSLPVRVLSFSRNASAGTASISWAGSPGFKYELQRSDLVSGVWTVVNTHQPTSAGTLSWTGSSLPDKEFFRVTRTPLPPPP